MIDPLVIQPCVFVVDDDRSARESIEILVRSLNLPCRSFPSAERLLAAYDRDWQGCLLLDVRLPGMSGFDLLRDLTNRRCRLPVIVISAQIDVRSAVQAMVDGAMTVIEKPYPRDELTSAIQRALALDAERRAESANREQMEQRVAQLTPVERDVMELLSECTPRKTIARRLGVSQRTAERMCARVYQKTETESPVGLARLLLQVRRAGQDQPHEITIRVDSEHAGPGEP